MMIYQQGDLDQACFLYSIANAYRALTRRRVDDRRIHGWTNIIKVTPSITQFLTTGSDFYNNKNKTKADQIIHESIARNAFEVLSTEEHQFRTSKISTDDITCTDFMNSVVIFCITDKAECEYPHGLTQGFSHWMVIVGRHETNYLLACSCRRFNRRTKYKEDDIPDSGRRYNNRIATKKLDEELKNIYPDYIYRISKINA